MDAGPGKDPNWQGSAKAANAAHVRYAIEVHHNAGGKSGPGSGATAYYWRGNTEGKHLAADLAQVCANVLGIRNRFAVPSTGLGFLRHTRMTAVLLEVAFMDGDYDAIIRADYVALGEALAREVVIFAGGIYVPLPAQGENIEARLYRLEAVSGTTIRIMTSHVHKVGGKVTSTPINPGANGGEAFDIVSPSQ